MDYKIRIVRFLYYFSLLGLLILYLFPGSLIGYFLYGDLGRQPDLIPNPLGSSINHALAFFYFSMLGLISYLNETSFTKVLIFLIALSLFSELSHLVIPNRSFQYLDIFGNLLGTLVAIVIIFLYKSLNMEKFDERKKSFEKKFAHDEELKFKVASRRNKYLGQWVSQKLGYDEEKEKEYIQSVIKADFQEAGDEDVFRKIKADLKDHNVSDEDIRNKIKEFDEKAKSDFI